MRSRFRTSSRILIALGSALALTALPMTPAQAITITPGVPVEASVAVAGGTVEYSFLVIGGEHLTFDIATSAWSGDHEASLRLYTPGGSLFDTVDVSNGATYTALTTDAGTAGTWTAVLDPDAGNIGSATFVIATDVKGGVLKRKTAKKTKIRYQGQQANYRFTAKAHRRLVFDVKATRWSGSHRASLSLHSPDGSYFASVDLRNGMVGKTRISTGAGTTGTWTAVLDAEDANTGHTTFVLR